MENLTERIMRHVAGLPEGTPVGAKELLHLGARPAIDQALSRLVRRGELVRASRGMYMRPVQTRFGTRPPSVESVVRAIAATKGETITSHGAAAANALGLTTQVPTRAIYLTSGPSRRLTLGGQTVELRHAPPWQLVLAESPAGDAVRAMAWLGREEARRAAPLLRRRLPASVLEEMMRARSRLPTWMAEQVSRLSADG